jgi:hypothetical protein
MHHRRSRTTHREGKRLDHKAFRMAEKQGRTRAPRTDLWGKADELPLPDDAVSTSGHRSKRKVPKKEKCPVNRVHEWYKEESTHEFTYVLWNDKTLTWTENVVEYTCIHCWKIKLHRYSSRYHNYRSDRKRSLPKRSVQF